MIQTVTGPLAADDLGVTCMHDHVLSDSSRLQRPGAEPAPAGDRVAVENLDYLRTNMLALADNLRLDDAELAVVELRPALAAGQRALVEATSVGARAGSCGTPGRLPGSGMTIVAAYGAYPPHTVPAPIAGLDERALEEHFARVLTDAIPGTGFRAGMLGIMGTTAELAGRECEQLRAAARAAVRTGAAVSVRLDPESRQGLAVLALVAAEGLPAERVVFTNADEFMDATYWDELAGAGAVLEMCFGTEAIHVGRVDNPSDGRRLTFFADFVAAHPASRHTLGQSVWTKAQLRTHGGFGYAHLVRDIVPDLAARGLTADRLEAMLVGEPRRLLDR